MDKKKKLIEELIKSNLDSVKLTTNGILLKKSILNYFGEKDTLDEIICFFGERETKNLKLPVNVWFLGGDQEQGDDDAGDERRPHDEEFQESEKSTDRDGYETTEDKDSGLSREHIYRPEGTGTVARISWMTSLVVIRRPELLFRKTSRCAKTGTASSLTSSGVV